MGSLPVNPLLTPYAMGNFLLKHRIVYAPLTRCRAIDTIPQHSAIDYYSSRADGGLMISEATVTSETGHGYDHAPGIHSEEQVQAWKPITHAVRDRGSTFFCQLWHVGRASYHRCQPGGAAPVSSSALPIRGQVKIEGGVAEYPVPRALETDEVAQVVADFAQGALNAIRAGFDGVEIHAANGYIIEQFLTAGVNLRQDKYGGSIQNLCRFAIEVTQACCDAIGSDRVAVRLSPFSSYLDCAKPDPLPLYTYLVSELDKMGLAYLHMVESRVDKAQATFWREEGESTHSLEVFRNIFRGPFMAAGGYTRESGMQAISDHSADLIAYGRIYLANPDLPKRFALNAPLNPYDRATFYTHDQYIGYLDYPFLESTSWWKERSSEGGLNAEADIAIPGSSYMSTES